VDFKNKLTAMRFDDLETLMLMQDRWYLLLFWIIPIPTPIVLRWLNIVPKNEANLKIRRRNFNKLTDFLHFAALMEKGLEESKARLRAAMPIEMTALANQAEEWAAKGSCKHCGEKTGFLTGKCKVCNKTESDCPVCNSPHSLTAQHKDNKTTFDCANCYIRLAVPKK
jgi:hypothetical protein